MAQAAASTVRASHMPAIESCFIRQLMPFLDCGFGMTQLIKRVGKLEVGHV